MKKLLLASLLFISLSFVLASDLYVHNPIGWNRQDANIDSALITIQPYLYYAQVDLELVYSAKGSAYNHPLDETWLEVVTNFEVPEKTIVIDSWLWIENYISEAYLIDIYTATNIYESYVQRTQDPSLLKYRSYANNSLDLNIYPLPANRSRKVKLSFLVPIQNESAFHSINPIVDIFQDENEDESSYCEIVIYNNNQFNQGNLITSPLNYQLLENNTNYSRFAMDINELAPGFKIAYQNIPQFDHYSYYATPQESLYYIEKFIPMNSSTCEYGTLNKLMDGQSIIIDNNLETEIKQNGVILRESGSYFNNPPEAIVFDYICDSTIYHDTVANQAMFDPSVEKIWAKNQIDILSNAQNYYYYSDYLDEIQDIIDLSMEYRVLSKYTAFLALPQEDTIQVMTNSNEPGITLAISDKNENQEIQLRAAPNPMKDYINFSVEYQYEGIPSELTGQIIDVLGRQISILQGSVDSNSEQLLFEWNGNNSNGQITESGMYYFVFELEGKKHSIAFIKL